MHPSTARVVSPLPLPPPPTPAATSTSTPATTTTLRLSSSKVFQSGSSVPVLAPITSGLELPSSSSTSSSTPATVPANSTSTSPATYSTTHQQQANHAHDNNNTPKHPLKLDPSSGLPLQVVPFSYGNPAVEIIQGWMYMTQLPQHSHPQQLLQQVQTDSDTIQPSFQSSPQSTSLINPPASSSTSTAVSPRLSSPHLHPSTSSPLLHPLLSAPSHSLSPHLSPMRHSLSTPSSACPSPFHLNSNRVAVGGHDYKHAETDRQEDEEKGQRAWQEKRKQNRKKSLLVNSLAALINSTDDEKKEDEKKEEDHQLKPPTYASVLASPSFKSIAHDSDHKPIASSSSPALSSAPSPVPPVDPSPPSLSDRLLYMFDIPAHITLNELHDFIGCNAVHMTHLQIVTANTNPNDNIDNTAVSDPDEPSSENTYIVLLLFRSPAAASEFLNFYNLKQFNSLEPDLCKVGWLHSIEFAEPERFSFPFHGHGYVHSSSKNNPTVLHHPVPSTSRGVNEKSRSRRGSQADNTATSDPSANDVPTCPVCLETIRDDHQAIITIWCNHLFHFDCIAKWTDSTCPVCRYVMQPNVQSYCGSCKRTDKLWMCILCGHVGCGRYANGHAIQHFQETEHHLSLDISTQRVWDYVSDEYVHRLVRNKTDGKLVEWTRAGERRNSASTVGSKTGGKQQAGKKKGGGKSGMKGMEFDGCSTDGTMLSHRQFAAMKLEELLIEYNYVLSHQLEKQRMYFQQQIRSLEVEEEKAVRQAESELNLVRERNQYLSKRIKCLNKAATDGQQSLSALEEQLTASTTTQAKLKALNINLLSQQEKQRNVLVTQQKQQQAEQDNIIAEKDKQIQALEEQLVDLQFYVKTQRSIGKSPLKHDIEGGQVLVPVSSNTPADSTHATHRDSATSNTAGAGSNGKKKNRKR